MGNVQSPVVMIIFNRPDLTEILFREVARAKPSKLLVIADGPRPGRVEEALRVAETRKIIERVDWECEVLRCFSDINLGCKNRVASGITWVFEQVEEAIILEDDCIPDPSFFIYCDDLLAKYRHDSEVMMIAGSCFLGERAPKEESYYFSQLPLIWGWASWRRAWATYDVTLRGWLEYRPSPDFARVLPSTTARRHYRRQIDRTYSGTLDTWDLQWSYAVWRANGVCINPTRNLIRNLGFGPGATHTHFYDPAFDPPVRPAEFPLRPPKGPRRVRPDIDRIWLDAHYSVSAKIKRRLRGYYHRLLGKRA